MQANDGSNSFVTRNSGSNDDSCALSRICGFPPGEDAQGGKNGRAFTFLKQVAQASLGGLEPPTFRLTAERANRLRHRDTPPSASPPLPSPSESTHSFHARRSHAPFAGPRPRRQSLRKPGRWSPRSVLVPRWKPCVGRSRSRRSAERARRALLHTRRRRQRPGDAPGLSRAGPRGTERPVWFGDAPTPAPVCPAFTRPSAPLAPTSLASDLPRLGRGL